MYKLIFMLLIATLVLVLAGCFESNSEKLAPPPIAKPPVGLIENGFIYYQSNCGLCHRAGQDDHVSAFGASDLAQRQDMITSDMSAFDMTSTYQLMGAYRSVPLQRVADLKVYFASLSTKAVIHSPGKN